MIDAVYRVLPGFYWVFTWLESEMVVFDSFFSGRYLVLPSFYGYSAALAVFLLSFAVGDGIFFSFLVFFVLVDGGDGFISNE